MGKYDVLRDVALAAVTDIVLLLRDCTVKAIWIGAVNGPASMTVATRPRTVNFEPCTAKRQQRSTSGGEQLCEHLGCVGRCLTCFPDSQGYMVGSVEGRVAVQHLEDAQQSKNFTFKCHRDGNDVYAVNGITFHPQYGTFVTSGSDGSYNFWDKVRRCGSLLLLAAYIPYQQMKIKMPLIPTCPIPGMSWEAAGTKLSWLCTWYRSVSVGSRTMDPLVTKLMRQPRPTICPISYFCRR